MNNIQFQGPRQIMVNGNSQGPSNYNPSQHQGMIRMNSALNMKDLVSSDEKNIANPNTQGMHNINNRNLNALQDYQMQLMLLEKQNKKRLDIAKNNGMEAQISINSSMLPPGQLQSDMRSQQNLQRGSPTTIMNSPVTNTEPSPNLAKKKDFAPKKSRKSSYNNTNANSNGSNKANAASNLNSIPSNVANGSANATNSNGSIIDSKQFKKEYSTPLTPNSEANEGTGKRKRKNTHNQESPNKSLPKTSARDRNMPNENQSLKAADKDTVPDQLNEGIHDSIVPSNLLLFPSEILYNNSNGKSEQLNFLDSSNRATLDEVEFDFNQFLDAGNVNGLPDSISNYNWGDVNAIEQGE